MGKSQLPSLTTLTETGKVKQPFLFSFPPISLSFCSLQPSPPVCLSCPRLTAQAGEGNCKPARRCRGLLVRAGGLCCQRFSGSEPRARTLHLPVLRRREKVQREGGDGRTGGGGCARVKCCRESRAVIQWSFAPLTVSVLRSPHCPEAFFSFAGSVVARASRISI